jgi:CDP-glucose 4,6-dehydratase
MDTKPSHVLVTGHTGFKGSWLIILLKSLGYRVSGISLPAQPTSLFTTASLERYLDSHISLNILERKRLQEELEFVSPDVVIHFAAQPLVRDAYRDPVNTFDVNIMGTLNLLQSIPESVKTTLIITTDKVYKEKESNTPHNENDPLGSLDPYSASKAAADIVTQSWMNMYPTKKIGIARAGNVIGGGDYSHERLLPNLLESFISKQVPVLRYPAAIRPWQHVLDCLNGYIILSEHLIQTGTSGTWNFGPPLENDKTVENVIDAFSKSWGKEIHWKKVVETQPNESGILILDSSKARELLGWKDKLNFDESIRWTADWYKKFLAAGNAREITQIQIESFSENASYL